MLQKLQNRYNKYRKIVTVSDRLYFNKFKYRVRFYCTEGYALCRGYINKTYAFYYLYDKPWKPFSYYLNSLDESAYLMRRSHQTVTLFVNDDDIFEKVLSFIDKTSIQEISAPAENHSYAVGKIYRKSSEYKFRIKLKNISEPRLDILNWANENPKKIKMGNGLRSLLQNPSYWNHGYYFYVKDDKTSTMARLKFGDIISSVDEIVVI